MPQRRGVGPTPGVTRRGPDLMSAGSGGGNVDQTAPGGSASATLGGVRHVLDGDFRGLMRLADRHLLVEAMMAGMLDMMATHLGIGVQGTRLHRSRLGNSRLVGNSRLGDGRLRRCAGA